jgi:hypothetical protein
MTTLKPRKSTTVAIFFIGGMLISVGLPGAPQNQTTGQNDFSHVAQVKKTYTRAGDVITVDEVSGPSEERVPGNTYEVKGTYKLASREKALLGAFVTISSRDRDLHPETSTEQRVMIVKGEGRFTLRFHIWQAGNPHVSFYPAEGGGSFGGVYF